MFYMLTFEELMEKIKRIRTTRYDKYGFKEMDYYEALDNLYEMDREKQEYVLNELYYITHIQRHKYHFDGVFERMWLIFDKVVKYYKFDFILDCCFVINNAPENEDRFTFYYYVDEKGSHITDDYSFTPHIERNCQGYGYEIQLIKMSDDRWYWNEIYSIFSYDGSQLEEIEVLEK